MSRASRDDTLRHLPIDGQKAFTTTAGKFREKLKKQQLNILRRFVPILKHVLDADEDILLAARSISPVNILEELTTGGFIFFIRRCVLVVTDKRILHFTANPGFGPRESVSQICFNDIESFRAGRKIRIKYKNGSKETFHRVLNGKKLGKVLSGLASGSSASTQYRGRHSVCPKCTSALVMENYTCPQCRLQFKDPRSARLLSMTLPGAGYFYTRHPFLGMADALVQLPLIFFLLLYLLGDFLGAPRYQGGLLIAAALGGVLLVEKLVGIYLTSNFIREYIPVERIFKRISKN